MVINYRSLNRAFLLFLVLVVFSALGRSLSFAVDSPHNSVHEIDCESCHDPLQSSPTSTWWINQDVNVCGQCHNTGLDKDVLTHKNETGVLAQCTLCHDPHRQQQSRIWKSPSYLETGRSDLATGITTTSLTNSAANWSPDQWKGMLLIPNVNAPAYNYRISSNTNKTIYIDTGGLPPANEIDFTSITSGNTFAIVLGRYVKSNINKYVVKFFRETGTNSFADNDAILDGVCQVCHTATTSFSRKTGVLEGPGHPASEAGRKCTLCHDHQGGFKASCKDCHGTPPVTTNHGGPDGLAIGNSDPGPGSTSPGAHSKHVVSLGYTCDTCHTGGMPESAIRDNKQIQIGFNIAAGSYQTGTYDGRTALANGYTYSAGNAGTRVIQSGSTTCSSVYCHTNGTSVATGTVPVASSPSWSSGAINTCTVCHGFPPSYPNNSPKANSHGSHNYTCENCHYATTTTGNSITGVSSHTNGSYDLVSGPGRSFSYSFTFPKGTCSNVSCHSNTGTAWGASACLDCHSIQQGGRAAIKQQFEANSHHVQGVAVIDGRHCYRCHWEANQDGSINPNFHGGSAAPGSPVDLVIYGSGTRPDTYSSATATQYTPNGDRLQIARITTHCLGCHSTQNNGTDPFGDLKTPKQYSSVSIELRYAATGTTRWGKYDPNSYANVEAKYNTIKAYSAHGNASANEQGWNSKGNDWAILTAVPVSVFYGGGLASDGNNVYALAGANTQYFYRYSLTAGTWAPMSQSTWISYGGALVYGGGDFLYALAGGNSNGFYRYSISGNTWTQMLSTPGPIYSGGALAYPGTGNYIYAFGGNGTTAFYRYSISGNSWAPMTGTPAGINFGGALATAGSYIYGLGSGGSASFYRYSINDNTWTARTSTPEGMNNGAALVYPGAGDFIYALRGGSTTAFYRYSISNNAWARMTAGPAGLNYGAGLAYPGTGNYIYATQGGNSTGFYRYFIDQWTNKTGSVRVECFDCHNSHGSNAGAASDDRTTSYTSAVGGVKGGILKDTVLSPSGYTASYTPATGGSDVNKNVFKAGAALCFDCHLTATAGIKPWGYQSTFGAAQKIIGYWDTEYFGPGTFGPQDRFPYKAGTGHAGGHFGASRGMTTSPAHSINGLCTPCHDPHGIDPSSPDAQYKVPLLKGTWMTSPYKEDASPASNVSRTNLIGSGEGAQYHIDQNTFGLYINSLVTPIAEPDSRFAGLCLDCHPKTSLTTTGTPNTGLMWKSKDRIHRTVAGWGYPSNTKHNYTCSKCHAPHNSLLPRLMVTNCMDNKHKGRVANNSSPVVTDASSGTGSYGGGSGTGRIPGSYNGSGGGSKCCGGPNPGNWTVTCHENDTGSNTDQRWNDLVTEW